MAGHSLGPPSSGLEANAIWDGASKNHHHHAWPRSSWASIDGGLCISPRHSRYGSVDGHHFIQMTVLILRVYLLLPLSASSVLLCILYYEHHDASYDKTRPRVSTCVLVLSSVVCTS